MYRGGWVWMQVVVVVVVVGGGGVGVDGADRTNGNNHVGGMRT